MKVCHISFSDLLGGANLTAYRLHRALQETDVDSSMLVRLRKSTDPRVVEFDTGSRRPERIYRAWRRQQIGATARKLKLNPEHPAPSLTDPRTEWGPSIRRQLPPTGLLHLHWINRFVDWPGFFRPMGRSGRPLFWTLHDMTPLTGGCAYDYGCGRFVEGCGQCPQLAKPESRDASSRFFAIKHKAIDVLSAEQMVLLPPNRWMENQIARSPVLSRFRREVIPYGVDIPNETILGSAAHADHLQLIAAAVDTLDRRKNLSLLLDALAALPDTLRARVRLTLIGQGDAPVSPPCPVTTTGYIEGSEALAAHYAAADLYVHPALEDNQPNTVLEAMAAGTPALVCDTGGVAEMIPTGHNWPMIVPRNDKESMTRALAWWIENRQQAAAAGQHCRSHVEKHFSRSLQIERHVKLYQEWRDVKGDK